VSERTRALFAGLAAHSFLSLDEPLSAAFAILMAVSAHAVGWPIPRGGAQSLTNALCGFLSTFGSKVNTSMPVHSLAALANYDLLLCDLTPRQLLRIGGQRLSESYQRQLAKHRYGAGAFKVDYALNAPIPWKDSNCLRAATVHLGGSFEEIAASEKAVRSGHIPDRPFVLLAQPSLFDSSRAPAGKHTAWAYCHVPNGSKVNMLEKLEHQIERFAPGFRDCILARRVFSPAELEAWTPTSWEAMSEAASWIFASFCFVRHGGTTPLRPAISIFALPPLRPVEECMACAAIMRRRWRCPGWTVVAKRVLCARAAGIHSRGPAVGHSMPRIVPSGSRSSVGA
jgi:phytoene dehydrogenase-like protein